MDTVKPGPDPKVAGGGFGISSFLVAGTTSSSTDTSVGLLFADLKNPNGFDGACQVS